VDLRRFCVDLYSFCGENCAATGCKLLILFEGVAAAQFVRAFWKKNLSGVEAAERDWPRWRVVAATGMLLIFMILNPSFPTWSYLDSAPGARNYPQPQSALNA